MLDCALGSAENFSSSMGSALPQRKFQTWRRFKSRLETFRTYLRKHHDVRTVMDETIRCIMSEAARLSAFFNWHPLDKSLLSKPRSSASGSVGEVLSSERVLLECWERKRARGFIKDPGPRHSNSVIIVYLLIQKDNWSRARFTARTGSRLVRLETAQQLWHAPYF